LEVRVPLPTIGQQRRIVDLIAAVDKAIEASGAFKREAEQAKRSLLRELLGSKDRSEDCFEEPISSLLELTIGGIWGSEPGADEEEVAVVRSTEFRNDGRLEVSTASHRSVTSRQLASRQLKQGDILLEKSGGGPNQPVGRVVRVEELERPTVCSNFVQLLRANSDLVDGSYLFAVLWYLHAMGATLSYQSHTTGIRNLRTKDYLQQSIPLPPLNKQRQVVALVSAIDELAYFAERAEDESKRVRSVLLADLLSGDHEIPESYDELLSA
jgi:type I restriction enzyme, S subunit